MEKAIAGVIVLAVVFGGVTVLWGKRTDKDTALNSSQPAECTDDRGCAGNAILGVTWE